MFDVSNPRVPTLDKIVEGNTLLATVNQTWPHSVHTLPDGNILVSLLGSQTQEGAANFLIVDSKSFAPLGLWADVDTPYGYDFWFQISQDILMGTEWGDPVVLHKGFDPNTFQLYYGHSINMYKFSTQKLIQTVDLNGAVGADQGGWIPLESRFLHDPASGVGMVAAALSSTIFAVTKDGSGNWQATAVIIVPNVNVNGWALPFMPGLITDFVISLDDQWLYLSNWIQGDIRQYNISDPFNPILTGQAYIGGSLRGGVTLADTTVLSSLPNVPTINGTVPRGGPQMLQLSTDGTRIYVTTSLFASWDQEFYPNLISKGAHMIHLIADNVNGGLTIAQNFLVDFENEPYGPALAHEIRYPGGDCSSDIWL
jgi:selenium-binding protein 1